MANLKSKKKVWMNALRQTKEYKLSDQGGEYTVPYKGADAKPSPGLDDPVKQNMKKRTMNELRQTKEYYIAKQKVLSDGGFDTNEEMKQIAACVKEIAEIDPVKEYKQRDLNSDTGEECPLDPVEEAKIEIIDKVSKHFHDMLFEMICEEMSNRYVFQSQEYLTKAGLEEFEEQFFEFYHEHHGEILYKVLKNITNG